MVEYIGGGCKCTDLKNQGIKVTCTHTHEMKSNVRKPRKKGKGRVKKAK